MSRYAIGVDVGSPSGRANPGGIALDTQSAAACERGGITSLRGPRARATSGIG